jgi:hypothetical protein
MALNNHILALIEPSIQLDKIKFTPFKDAKGETNVNEGIGADVPYVIINGYQFEEKDIISLEISLSDLVPKISLSVTDGAGQFMVDTFPRDGDVISVRIAAPQSDVYKDIRIDFDIIDVQMPAKAGFEIGSGLVRYNFTGVMKVPGLFSDKCQYLESDTSVNHLSQIANELGLGLATNIDAANDAMQFIIAYDSMIDAIKNRVDHSYIDDESFQTFSIDPYYYINYVNLNSILESEEDIEQVLLNIERKSGEETKADVNNSEEVSNVNVAQVLSNHENYEGTNMYIIRYGLKNKSGKAMQANGYKRTVQFYENDSEGQLSFDIEALSSTKLRDIEEPLKGRRGEERYKSETKAKYMGRTHADENSNVHLNYNYARMHNQQNIDELKKMVFEVELDGFNPAFHKYQKLPVLIYNYTADQVRGSNLTKQAKARENFDASEINDGTDQLGDNATLDDFLSGYYVIGDIKYRYSSKKEVITQVLTLLRREWPSRLNNIG